MVPVVIQAKDGAWSPALLNPRTSGLKYYQGRREHPPLPCRLGSDRQTEHSEGTMSREHNEAPAAFVFLEEARFSARHHVLRQAVWPASILPLQECSWDLH